MNIITDFPTIKSDDYDEFDAICHSLIEGTVFKTYSFNYLISVINFLKIHHDKNGENIVIDKLFMKYLKAIASQNYSTLQQIVELTQHFTNKEINSQYHVAFIAYYDQYDKRKFREKIFGQMNNNNKIVKINGITVSDTILYYLNRKFKPKLNIENVKNKHICCINYEYPQNSKEFIEYFASVFPNIKQFFDTKFWKFVVVEHCMTNYTIDVKKDIYLFSAAVCLMYNNPMANIILDVKNFKFPEIVTQEIEYLMKNKINCQSLLEMDNCSVETKNLCNLVYLLVLNQSPLNDLRKYEDSMSFPSFLILILVYKNYVNEIISEEFVIELAKKLNVNDQKCFTAFKLLFSMTINCKNLYSIIQTDLIYILPKRLKQADVTNEIAVSKAFYGYMKKRIMNGDVEKDGKEKTIEVNNDDFKRFIIKASNNANSELKFKIYLTYIVDYTKEMSVCSLIITSIDAGKYDYAYEYLKNIKNSEKVNDFLTQPENFIKIKKFIQYGDSTKVSYIIIKFNFYNYLQIKEKMDIYFKHIHLNSITLDINRQNALNQSQMYFKKENMCNKYINVNFRNEPGIDGGGIAREWFTVVSNELAKSDAFKIAPNGNSLTINEHPNDDYIYQFTGQFLGVVIQNKRNVKLNFTSFIWKKLLNIEITLEDMKDYDIEIYNSLKWISKNDPKPLMTTFVDMNDIELCENGNNIELNNENKNEYIQLMIERILVNNNEKALNNMREGFNKIVSNDNIKLFGPEDIKYLVNGIDIIDVNEWKHNTNYNNKKQFDLFFDIISKWPQEKLRKLLRFITGSPMVPINGFGYYVNLGGSIRLNFVGNSSKLPVSHTCYNSIDIPTYKSKEEFDHKLSWAIEGEEFGFS